MAYFDALTFAAVTWGRLRRTRTASSRAFVLWQLASIPLVHAALRLDRALHPEIADVAVAGPLFVVGNFRSGTTFLLRLLAADPRNACFSTYELGLPSPTLRRLVPPAFRAWAARMLARHLSGLDDIHPLRLDAPEEDELLFLHLGNSGHYELLLPLAEHHARRVRRPWDWPLRKRDRFGAFHRACVQRLLWERGVPRYVGKSPHFGGRIADLRRWYPDARFLYLVRSPLDAIPSALSMAAAFWRATGIDAATERGAMASLYRSLVALYVQAEQQISRLPDGCAVVVRYPDLLADPRAVLIDAYARLGWTLTAPAAAAVAVELAHARERRSRHAYGLASFGLDEAVVRRDLGFLLDKYRLDDAPDARGDDQLLQRGPRPAAGK